MNEKLKHIISHRYVQQFKDIRAVGLLVFGVIALLVSWSSLGVIQRNYELQQQISRLQQENEVQQLENSNQALKNQYFNTNAYLELQARKEFGKAAPGETLVLVPKETALSYVDEASSDDDEQLHIQQPKKPAYQQNFEAWMEFLFRRQAQ